MTHPGGRLSTDGHGTSTVYRWQLKRKRGSLPCRTAQHKMSGKVHWVPRGSTRTLCGIGRASWFFTRGPRKVTCMRCALMKED